MGDENRRALCTIAAGFRLGPLTPEAASIAEEEFDALLFFPSRLAVWWKILASSFPTCCIAAYMTRLGSRSPCYNNQSILIFHGPILRFGVTVS